MALIHLDVDECETKKNRCPANSQCVNDVGSYDCVCQTGYQEVNKEDGTIICKCKTLPIL